MRTCASRKVKGRMKMRWAMQRRVQLKFATGWWCGDRRAVGRWSSSVVPPCFTPPPQKPDEADEDGGRWKMESRKLCVRALSNLAATAATEAHEKLCDWEKLLEHGTGKTHNGGVMDVLITPAAADHYMDEIEAKRRRKARRRVLRGD